MPKRTVVVIEDDFDGAELAEADALDVVLAVSVNGEVEAWGLCLSAKSLEAWRKANAKFTKADLVTTARLVTGATSGGTSGGPTGADPRTPRIRAWWEKLSPGQLMDMGNLKAAPESGRGKIPGDVVEAYEKANPEDKF
jgi:hypothetical protein